MDDEKENRKINTGGGTYIEGNVNTGGGDFVGHDKIVKSGASADEISTAFLKLYQGIEKLPDPEHRKEALDAAKKLEAEARKGDQADESRVERWFNFLAGMGPDIFDVAVTTFTNPIAGVGKVFQMIAAKAKEEHAKKS
jgi:hypothetical protein